MTKTEIAVLAIANLPIEDCHIAAVEVCRTLKLTTDEAANVRKELGLIFTQTPWEQEERKSFLKIVKNSVNSYARDYRLR